jgi:acyl-CoA thioesterase FadM
VELEIRASVKEIKGRKVVVSATLSAQGEVCAQGEVIAVQVPEHMIPGLRGDGEQDQPQDG